MEPKDIKTLFEYFDGQFSEVSQRFDRLETKVDGIQTAVDGLTKRFDVFEQELVVTRHRLDKLEQWARMVSEKVGIPLPF